MEMANGVFAYVYPTAKFKDIGISLRFMAPLASETATIRSLLAMMITDRCEAYPSKKAMSDHQDFLYGTMITAQTLAYGKAQVLDIRLRLIDPCYVEEKDLLPASLAFLHQILFHPLLNEESLIEAKKLLKVKLERIHDDPKQYAVTQGLQIAGRGTPLAISPLGDWQQGESVTLNDIRDMHQRLLHKDRIDIIGCGALDEGSFLALVKEYLPFTNRNINPPTYYTVQCQQHKAIHRVYRKIQQCSIFMLWQTNTDICDQIYLPLRLGTALFGQYSTSLLFHEVREKHSLCYSIYASLLAYDGALTVTTGVEQEHIEAAVALIQQQFQRMVIGDFDDDLLKSSKTMMIHSLKASKDSLSSLIAQQYQNQVLNQAFSIDDRIARIARISKAEIMAAFQKCLPVMKLVVCQKGEG